MRKDVRTGAVIGGILIAVLVVYVLVTAGRGKPVKPVAIEGNSNSPAGQPVGGAGSSTPAGGTDVSVTPSHDGGDSSPAATATPASNEEPPHITPVPPSELAPHSATNWAALLSADHIEGPLEPVHTRTPPPAASAVDPAPTASSSADAPVDASVSSSGAATDPPASASGSSDKPAAPAPAAPKTHKIQSGETFSSISRSVYGDAKYFKDIIKANPKIDPTHLKPGMTITLPDLSQIKHEGKTSAKESAKEGETGEKHLAPAPAPVDPKTEYRVQGSDNLYKISIKLYHTANKVDAIYQLNKEQIGSDPAKLKLNMVLKLPEPPAETASR